MSQLATCWKLAKNQAQLSLSNLHAQVDLARPELGLQALTVASQSIAFQPVDGRLLAITPSDAPPAWPARVVDAYVRGNDVVATYAGQEHWPFAPQIYWSAESEAANGGTLALFTVVVSIQTDLLDTNPRLVVQSTLATDEILLVSVVEGGLVVDSHAEGIQEIDPRADACGLVWRLPGDELSYAEIMPLGDFRQLSVVRTPNTIESRWELFAEFLEKGVIRRVQLQAIFVPRENDVQLVAEHCQAIAKRPLPLTT